MHMDSANFHSNREHNSHPDKEQESPARPVFFDEKRTRWHGFLIFSGSALATIAFLAGIIWFSVAYDPQFKPLPSYLPDADTSLIASTTSAGTLTAPAPEAQLEAGVALPLTADTGKIPSMANRIDAADAMGSPAPAPMPPSDNKSTGLSKMDIEAQQTLRNSPSITVLDGADSKDRWVSYVGAAEEVRSPDFFTLAK